MKTKKILFLGAAAIGAYAIYQNQMNKLNSRNSYIENEKRIERNRKLGEFDFENGIIGPKQ